MVWEATYRKESFPIRSFSSAHNLPESPALLLQHKLGSRQPLGVFHDLRCTLASLKQAARHLLRLQAGSKHGRLMPRQQAPRGGLRRPMVQNGQSAAQIGYQLCGEAVAPKHLILRAEREGEIEQIGLLHILFNFTL